MTIESDLSTNGFLLELAQRVHSRQGDEATSRPGHEAHPPALDVLWTRKVAAGSRLADHIANVKQLLYRNGRAGGPKRLPEWRYDPELELRRLQTPQAQNGPFEAWSRNCAEMVQNGRDLLGDIMRFREGARTAGDAGREENRRRVWTVPVVIGSDPVGAILERARAGANAGRSTKSKVEPCTAQSWAGTMNEFGLRGVAAYPVFIGSWWMALLLDDFRDWRQDFLAILDYSFFFEYNVDSAATFRHQDQSSLMLEIAAVWDMPDLPPELQVRRSHMACSMAFFDLKRKHETKVKSWPTDGLTAWVHGGRDQWRDFKALDSGGYPHYLSFAKCVRGRDDMMLSGLVNDWVDIGPDLRYEECNQSVLALTRGSLAMSDLLDCYRRTVWMLNAQFNAEDRYAGCMATIGACVWGMCNHRHDVWLYYALAFDLCAAAESLDLYRMCELADLYTPDLRTSEPACAQTLTVHRRQLRYGVMIDGTEYSGEVALHRLICDAVHDGILPMSIVEYQFILPTLLREGRITPPCFLAHMDRAYCDHFASVVRSGHASGFSRTYCRAVAALVMEQWWAGMYFAIGAGSLIDAQPDRVAGDRAH